MSGFLSLIPSKIPLYFREEARGYCMELENVVPLDPLPVFHHRPETKDMVNTHSLHNGRIPLNKIDHGENMFLAANAELCVSDISSRFHLRRVASLWSAYFSAVSIFILTLPLSRRWSSVFFALTESF